MYKVIGAIQANARNFSSNQKVKKKGKQEITFKKFALNVMKNENNRQ